MNIKVECVSLLPRVKDYRGYEDMIFNLAITLDCIDLDTNSKVGYSFEHIFDTEVEYTEENSFKQFEDITEEEINSLVNNLISNHKVQGYKTIEQWAEERLNEVYSQPSYKPFPFQTATERVGIGISGSSPDP